jgi:hypothetical protein
VSADLLYTKDLVIPLDHVKHYLEVKGFTPKEMSDGKGIEWQNGDILIDTPISEDMADYKLRIAETCSDIAAHEKRSVYFVIKDILG